MPNRLSDEKFNEVGTMLVSNYIEDFYLALRMRDFKVAEIVLRGIDNLEPGAYFTEKHSDWFTKAKKLLERWVYKRPKLIKLRGGRLYLEWRITCLIRDKWKCQVCRVGSNLHIHHIKSYKDFVDRRLDVNNGITLCKYHHKLEHKKR